MKNTKLKRERGITLVALVITIVVLLILAAVVMLTLTGENNIITKARTSKDNYSTASVNEEDKIAEYEGKIFEETGNFWQKKGLVSSNVLFGKTYTSTTYSRGDCTNATITITDNSWTLSETGGITMTVDKSTYDNGVGEIMDLGADKDQAVEFVESMLPVKKNSVGIYDASTNDAYLIEFENNGVAKLYYGEDVGFGTVDWSALNLIGSFRAN